MCFPQPSAQPSETIVDDTTPPPTPPPTAPAASPSPNQTKSQETQDSAAPTSTGYASLIIPRTALAPVSQNVSAG